MLLLYLLSNSSFSRGAHCCGKSACRKYSLQYYKFLTARGTAHLDVQTSLLALAGDDVSQIVDTELLCKLVEHAHLAIVGWVVDGQLDAAHLYAQTHDSGLTAFEGSP